MTLKLILDSIEGLPADVAAEYVEQSDGTYRLDVEGMEDTGALKRAKDHEKRRRQEAERKATELQSQIDELQEQMDGLADPGKNKADDTMRRKLQEKIDALEGKLSTREKELLGEITRLTSTARAESLANELSDYPQLMIPHVEARLRTVIEDGKAVVKVLDPDGDVGVMTLDELKKEFIGTKEFAPLIRGGKGSGSGAPGNGRGGSQGKTKLEDYSGQERLQLQRENPAEFQRLLDQSRKSRG